MAHRASRRTSVHEGGHAVAHHFFPLSGKTTSVTIDREELADYNAPKHPVNEAAGLHFSGRTLSPIVGRSVDREQIHHELIALLAGYVAGWIYAGERRGKAKRDLRAEEEVARHSDGSDDFSRVVNLLFDADPFDRQAVLKRIPDHARGRDSAEALTDRYFRPAFDAHKAQIVAKLEALWCEAVAFVVEKWPHIQAVADALWQKRTLSGEEVVELIERIEDRIRSIPPSLREILKSLRSGDEERQT
jgi:hypothetical protein